MAEWADASKGSLVSSRLVAGCVRDRGDRTVVFSRSWRNWQTRRTESPVISASCRFDSCRPQCTANAGGTTRLLSSRSWVQIPPGSAKCREALGPVAQPGKSAMFHQHLVAVLRNASVRMRYSGWRSGQDVIAFCGSALIAARNGALIEGRVRVPTEDLSIGIGRQGDSSSALRATAPAE